MWPFVLSQELKLKAYATKVIHITQCTCILSYNIMLVQELGLN